jgi:hypothetical protein
MQKWQAQIWTWQRKDVQLHLLFLFELQDIPFNFIPVNYSLVGVPTVFL